MADNTTTTDSPAAGAATTTATTATTTSAVSEPWFKDWVQSDGSLNSAALERLPDHLKPLKDTWGRIKSIDDLGVSTVNAQVLIGKKALAPLPPGSPPEAVTARKQLLDTINGVPSDPKAYNITKPQEVPDAQWNQGLADNFSKWCHTHSVSPAAAKELMNLQMTGVRGQLEAQAQYENTFWADQQKTFEAQVRAEGIPADRAAMLVEKGAVAAGLDLNNERTKIFLKGADARLLAMHHAIAIGEDRSSAPNAGGGESSNLSERLSEARAHPAFWNKEGKYSRTDHDAAVNRVNELLRLQSEQESKLTGSVIGRTRR